MTSPLSGIEAVEREMVETLSHVWTEEVGMGLHACEIDKRMREWAARLKAEREKIDADIMGKDAALATLKGALAMIRERNERLEPFLKAAMEASAHVSKYFPDEESREGANEGDLLILRMVDAFRALASDGEVKP